MANEPPTLSVRNARLYPWYVVCLNGFYWFPVFLLYLTEHVGIGDALILESIYYAAVVALEVPSGWASDKFGRRLALRASMAMLTLAYAAFFFGDSFATLALAQVLLAAGYASNSGTDTAFHYDSLVAAGLEDEFADREEKIARLSFGMVAISALAGGAIASLELRYAYGLSFVSSLVGLGITVAFAKPEAADAIAAERFDRQIIACVRQLADPVLRWAFGFVVLLTVLIHIPYQIYQPYLELLPSPPSLALPTPLLTGAHAFLAMLIAAWFSGRSVRWSERFGLSRVALGSVGLLVVLIALTGTFLHPMIALLLLFRSMPRALTLAPMNALVTPRLPRQLRASYLSVQSLAGRLSFSVLLAVLSLAATTRDPTWADVSTMSLIAAVVGLAGWLALAGTAQNLDRSDS